MMIGGLNTGGAWTAHTTTTSNSVGQSSIMAVVEGKGQTTGEVGIASLDLFRPEVVICQFHDTQSYSKVLAKVNVFNPVEILMPQTVCDVLGEPSRLYLQIRKEFPQANICPLQRKLFNDGVGIQQLQYFANREYDTVLYTVSQKYFALAAVAALFKYIELVRNIIFPANSLKIEFQLPEKTMVIDYTTSQHLELLRNSLSLKSNHSLLGILNYCRTPGGMRCLRANILQPMCDVDTISRRLDCIQELRNDPIMLYNLLGGLNKLPQDMERVIATLIHIPKVETTRILEQRINYIIFLKQTLEFLPVFVEVLAHAHHLFFHSVRQEFMNDKFDKMQNRIRRAISDEAQFTTGNMAMRMQRLCAINSEINPFLDISRKALHELQDDAIRYVQDLSSTHQMNLRLMENASRGYYISTVLPQQDREQIVFPEDFLNVTRKNNSITFTTQTLLLLEQRMSRLLEEAHNISTIIVTELLQDIREDVGYLYKVGDAISELDVLYALTTYSMTPTGGGITRPTFSPDFTAIRNGRHPILDIISSTSTVPNDLFMSADSNVAVITGPNMSGKTTILKQIATLQVLAQIGSFVPAESATFRLTKQIFSRIGNGDKLEENASSFVVEMREMNYILDNTTSSSLIIVDELGRSTSIDEGTAISWAMIESLMRKNAFIFFATHYLFLTKLETLYPNVLNYKLDTLECFEDNVVTNDQDASGYGPRANSKSLPSQISRSQLDYTHVLRRGATDIECYGLKLAKSSSFPPSVIQRAMAIAQEIQQTRTKSSEKPCSKSQPHSEDWAFSRKRAMFRLTSHIYMLSSTGIFEQSSRWEMLSYFQNLQEEFNNLMTVSDWVQTQG